MISGNTSTGYSYTAPNSMGALIDYSITNVSGGSITVNVLVNTYHWGVKDLALADKACLNYQGLKLSAGDVFHFTVSGSADYQISKIDFGNISS